MGVPLFVPDAPGQREGGLPVDPWRVEEPQPALALQQTVDHVQPDADASDQASRGFVVRGQRGPNPAYAAGPGDGGDGVHEGGTDTEAVVVVDHLHGQLGDAGGVADEAGDADRLPVLRGEPGHVAVTVDVDERLEHRRGQPDHAGEVAPGTRCGRHAVEDGQQRVPLPASQRAERNDAAAGERDGHSVGRRPRRGVYGQDQGGHAGVLSGARRSPPRARRTTRARRSTRPARTCPGTRATGQGRPRAPPGRAR